MLSLRWCGQGSHLLLPFQVRTRDSCASVVDFVLLWWIMSIDVDRNSNPCSAAALFWSELPVSVSLSTL